MTIILKLVQFGSVIFLLRIKSPLKRGLIVGEYIKPEVFSKSFVPD